jgi:amino acid adenylation domain-containing protein
VVTDPAPADEPGLRAEAGRLAGTLDLERGPCLVARIFDAGPARSLMVVASALACDGRSWRPLIDEITRRCGLGEAAANDRALPRDALRALMRLSPGASLPAPAATPEPVASGVAPSMATLVTPALARLDGVARKLRVAPVDLLATALYDLLPPLANGPLFIGLELDLRDTNRWNADRLPIPGPLSWMGTLELPATPPEQPLARLKCVKEARLGAAAAQRLPAAAPFAVLRLAPESPEPATGFGVRAVLAPGAGEHPRGAPISICWRPGSEGRLDVAVEEAPARPSASELGAALALKVEELLAAWEAVSVVAYTPSDFPLARITQTELDDVVLARAPELEDLYALSPMQSGLLFRGLYWPGSDSYFNQNVLELRGPLDVQALRAAWEDVAARYEILRTGFVWEGLSEPVQYVLGKPIVPWQDLDWSAVAPDHQRGKLEALMAEDRQRSFTLSDVPLHRLKAMKLAEDRYYLLWSHHHVLIDGWCLALIWGSVFSAYRRLVEGAPVTFEAVRPYRDYIAWLQVQSIAASEAFWRKYLEGFLDPTRFSPLSVPSEAEFETHIFVVSKERSAELKATAHRFGVTLNNVVQAVWSILLGLYSAAEDVVFGVSISGRPPEMLGVEQMVGLFINTIPLRVSLSADMTLVDLLRQLQLRMVQVVEHGHVPLAKIKSWSQAVGLDGRPLFDSLLAFENYPEDNLPVDQVAGIEIRDLAAVEKTEYPIGLIVLPGEELAFHLNYDTSHFTRPAIARLERQMRLLLEQIVTAPEAKLGTFRLMADEETRVMVEDWNRTDTPLPDTTLNALVEARAAQGPGQVAVVDGDRSVTYRELLERVHRTAGLFREMGVRPGDRVALCLDRSLALVEMVLAVMEAGAAYVALDPGHPLDRLALIAADAGARAIVVADPAPWSGAAVAARVLSSTWIEQQRGAHPAHPPAEKVRSSDIAAVFYTSGSTGKPKGVECPHLGLVNRLLWSQRTYRTGVETRLLQLAGITFDISLWEMLLPLVSGGTLFITEPGRHRDVGHLIAQIRRHAIDVIHFVPSLLDPFLAAPGAGECTSLRQVVCGGEALTASQCRRFQQLGLQAALHHAYGPTEGSISVSHWRFDGSTTRTSIPIGKPIDNTQLYVLDERRRPVPAGAPGEIYIGGVGLARGYLGDPALTAERFVADPFRGGTARLYRTGDRGRFDDEGNLEFLGRADHQVKIRGHRIELQEVDLALLEVEGVRSAATVTRDLGDAGAALVAYLVLEGGGPGDAETLARIRLALGRRLPPYMIPSALQALPVLPVTAQGKIDKRALAERPLGPVLAPKQYVPPRTALEADLVRVWEETLNVRPIGVNHNFFELGGHSLLMIDLVARTRRLLGDQIAVDITQVFKCPTIAALCAQATSPRGNTNRNLFPVQEAGAAPPLFLVAPGEGVAFAYLALKGRVSDQPIHALNNPRLGEGAYDSVEAMAADHVRAVRALRPDGPYRLGGWSFGGLVALEMARRLQSEGAAVEVVLLIDSYGMGRDSAVEDVAGLREQLRGQGLDPGSDEGATLLREITHAGRLAARYRPAPYHGQVVLLKAAQGDPADPSRSADLRNGWTPAVLPRLEVAVVPGEHRLLFHDDNVSKLSRAIETALMKLSDTKDPGP